jgi:hypothetical protein
MFTRLCDNPIITQGTAHHFSQSKTFNRYVNLNIHIVIYTRFHSSPRAIHNRIIQIIYHKMLSAYDERRLIGLFSAAVHFKKLPFA